VTLGFNVVLALFVLAPGFAALAGIWVGSQHERFRPSAPPPGSILSLSVVTFGALAAHTTLALLMLLRTPLVDLGERIQAWIGFGVPWRMPNPYVVILALKDGAPSELDIALTFLLMLLLSVAAFFTAAALVQSDSPQGRNRRLLYGWLADLVEQVSEPNRYITAFVLTDIEKDGRFLGYEGLVENMTMTNEKQVASILLSDANTFYVSLESEKIGRVDVPRASAIPLLHIAADNIKNIAFQPFELVTDSEFDEIEGEPATPLAVAEA